MADLATQIKEAKHPWPLKKAYAGHKRHIRKLFRIQDQLKRIKAEAAENRSTSVPVHSQMPEPPIQPPTQDPELLQE